ncbi:MAG: nitric oxide reductase transcriptional regulator NorR [Burkholderiaceae bacterium]|jgi:anaerobic nitric oxide reductase transcription regulator|nr:nitric oxide reductase transcriptional regulator NorR [Burkholderiaceae bacterium]
MIESLLFADFANDLPAAVRLQRLVSTLRAHFHCGAVVLLRLEGTHLRPVAVEGLVHEALGRRFAVSAHPRLAAILARYGVTHFHHESALPDPYDGLLDTRTGEPLPVHDCIGVSLHVEGRPWGVLTLDALQVGAFDEDAVLHLQRLTSAVEAAVRISRLESEIRALRLAHSDAPAGGQAHEYDEGDILGQSEAIVHLLNELQVVAESDLPVLLFGETGVGKELFAHRLHRLSRRRHKPMVHVNCAALPESLAESELFGHVRGAFSGASSERPGRFEAADGGTLFLDEVGELPLAIQAKLLRTLQNGEIQRLGADRPRHVDVRVIAATNRSLREQVRGGHFRADLYHRLSVYPIPIPPLRDRDDDVLLLAGRFLERNRARLGLRSLRLSTSAEQALRAYPWPGNVRELEHVISRAALKAVSRGARRTDIVTLEAALLDLDWDDNATLPSLPLQASAASAADLPTHPAHNTVGSAPAAIVPLRETLAHSQRQAITAALAAHRQNWAQAARALGLDSSNLHKLARRLGLKEKT